VKQPFRAIVAALMIGSASIAPAHASAQTPPPAHVDAVLAGLRAGSWQKRDASLQRLVLLTDRDPALLNGPAVYDAMVALVRTENAIIIAHVRKSQDTSESFAGYYGDVLTMASKVLAAGPPETRQALLSAMVNGTYNSDSPYAKELAAYGEWVVAPALALTRTDIVANRWNAYAMLGEILRADNVRQLKYPLAPGSAARLRIALRGGLQDPETVTRRETVRAIVAADDREALPLLRLLAANDPDAGENPKQRRYSVRGLAEKAIATLQQTR
jgi:hypothetical protein